LLESAYLEKNYSLYEQLFAYYIQHDALEAKYFNWALKVFIRTNTEFAKQLLYQMVYSKYPIDEDTLYGFVCEANRVATFPTIKFVLDLVKNNDQLPIADKALGQLMFGFLRNGRTRDINEMEKYLESKGKLDSPEVIIGKFMHAVVSMDTNLVWDEVAQMSTLIQGHRGREMRFYNWLYHLLKKRWTVNDMVRYLRLVNHSGIEDSDVIRRRTLLNLGRMGEIDDLLEYIKLLKRERSPTKFLFINIWRSFVLNSPDMAFFITSQFKKFLTHSSYAWKSEALDQMGLQFSKDPSYRYEISNDSQGLQERVRHYIQYRQDNELMNLLNESLREGKRPSLELFHTVLKGLIRMNSGKSFEVYELVKQLYKPTPYHIDILWLTNETRHKSRSKSEEMIQKFIFNYDGQLRYPHFRELAQLAIMRNCDHLVVDIIVKALNSPQYRRDKSTVTLYTPVLYSLARYSEYEKFLETINYIEKEFGMSRAPMRQILNYSRLIKKQLEHDQLVEFEEKFEPIYRGLKERYSKKCDNVRTVTLETLKIMKTW
jgi:hypothetical protein